jgi:glycine dehydrogenase
LFCKSKIHAMQINTEFKEAFRQRHISPDASETQEMLNAVKAANLEQLISETIPASIRLSKPLNLPNALTEFEFLKEIRETARLNQIAHSFIGMGYYNTIVPGVILRNILENPGWYTQYTPYQAEIAQGRLEALLNFQTMICDLTGLPIANASLLDEGTAAGEAMRLMFGERSKEKVKADAHTLLVADTLHPQTLDVILTRAEPLDIKVVISPTSSFQFTEDVFGVILQYPDTTGEISDYSDLTARAHEAGVLVSVATDLLSLTLLKAPGEWGADVAFGSAQRLGVPMGYGGPHAAFFATREDYKREIPGRLIGVSADASGNKAYRMALQTREQHIRRDKATSNICTAQVLLAIMNSMYAVYHGPEGLKQIATRVHSCAAVIKTGLQALGYEVKNTSWFDTLTIAGGELNTIKAEAEKANMNFRYFSNGNIGISVDETTTFELITHLLQVFAKAKGKDLNAAEVKAFEQKAQAGIPVGVARNTPYLEHPVFNAYHSEHEMLRYIKRLESKDLSLAHSMISLGSCTMKLNATSEMIPVTMPEFGNIHPFAPKSQAQGYAKIFRELEAWLNEITGFAATSLQPNSGAQGEYAGLMVIREYLKSKNQGHRNVCVIPSSAHGTNPASAVMAGMKVVVTACDETGAVDFNDLKAKVEQHKDQLAALMVTYPSTHGVFDENIREVCELVHQNGGQVYMDGANMNAQVGLTSPRNIGADVCHLNLHKTFCIPHGGGGPGMGPICVAEHLAPFLPGHPVVDLERPQAMHAVSAAPWGSASILLISYAYIRMMGGDGLTDATRYAILNANYIKSRLEGHYKILYQGKHSRVAHEMILDTREFKNSAGIEAEDFAKRLMDYGFHAPTVSFPVAGTLMIEPTESESLAELDRFCDAMIAIREEIRAIEEGRMDKLDNPLKNAPHTAAVVTAETWAHGYSRQEAAYPAPWVQERKFWPSVSRINNTLGDRQLICVCPPVEAYAEVSA